MDPEIISLVTAIFVLLGILLLLLLAIASVAIIIYYVVIDIFFNKDKKNSVENDLKKYETWSFEKIKTRIELINKIVILEFFIALIVLVGLIWTNKVAINPETLQLQNIASFFYDNVSYTLNCPINSCTLSSNASFSLEKISIAIGLLGAIIVYAHFFEMLGDDRNSKKYGETQKKYFGFFVNLWVFTAIYTLFAIIVDVIKMDFDIVKQLLPLTIGWINVTILIPLPYYYRKNFENYEAIEKFNEVKKTDKNDSISSYIFILTILVAYLGYSLDFDILLLIFLEITLLLMYFWTKRFQNLPNEKCIIKLNEEQNYSRSPNFRNPPLLRDVYIIDENENSYTVILPNEEDKTIIMKSAIREIIILKKE
ncbi:MAG: hypothetical protein Q7J03_06805 [Methanoregula sp.]|nr:hypothetical protein [Methanoregula sp.]